MEEVKEDIKVLERFTKKEEGNEVKFDKYCSLFLFSTENQEGISKILNYDNKDVLTVASSADQYISSIYYGAKKSDIFDINKFTYYMSFFKIAAIKTLGYEEFLSFMIPYSEGELNKNFWNMRTFKKVVGSLPSDVAYFWENALYLFKNNGYGNFTYVTDKSAQKENILRGMPFYASEEEYYKLQCMLRKLSYPNFYLTDVCKLLEVVKDHYDIIYLSNIIESMVFEEISKYPYFCHVNENEIEIDKVIAVSEQVLNMLRSDGTILMSYRPNTNLEFSSDVLYNNDYFESELVPSKMMPDGKDYRRTEKTDIVLTYTPSRKGNFLG